VRLNGDEVAQIFSNHFFRTDSIVLIAITCSLLALYFKHEIRETLTSDSCQKYPLTNVRL